MFQAQSSLLAFQATKLVQSNGFLCNHDPAISSPAAPTDTSETPPKKTTKPKKGPRGGVYDPFPLKLHRMLKYAALENLEDIVSWMPHGRAFKIHDSKVFASTIMPKFFNQSKYTSFQRQLNLYGEGVVFSGGLRLIFLLLKRRVADSIRGVSLTQRLFLNCISIPRIQSMLPRPRLRGLSPRALPLRTTRTRQNLDPDQGEGERAQNHEAYRGRSRLLFYDLREG